MRGAEVARIDLGRKFVNRFAVSVVMVVRDEVRGIWCRTGLSTETGVGDATEAVFVDVGDTIVGDLLMEGFVDFFVVTLLLGELCVVVRLFGGWHGALVHRGIAD